MRDISRDEQQQKKKLKTLVTNHSSASCQKSAISQKAKLVQNLNIPTKKQIDKI